MTNASETPENAPSPLRDAPKPAFSLEAEDGHARAGSFALARGTIQTPTFMPVGTLGTVKMLDPTELRALGAQIILGNTYHLYLRPGPETLEHFGGLHRWMQWERPMLTDSGGFQFFSLSHLCRFSEEGVSFRSHLDGSKHLFTPERVMGIQASIGSDIRMVLDHVLALPAEKPALEDALARSTRWALRALNTPRESGAAVFAILQGGTDLGLRHRHRDELCGHGFDGFAIGGLSVGEAPSLMYEVLDGLVPTMPRDKPRYLMGVGTPRDILRGIAAGVDMFDCVMPTRNARNATVFTSRGRINVRNGRWRLSDEPLDAACDCAACRGWSLGYLHHLVRNQEALGPRLLSIHNLRYYISLTQRARAAILDGRFAEFVSETEARWAAGETS